MKKQHVVAVIFARGGSKGVPRKNIRLLAGKPLIAYAIETALASDLVDRVVVSTEDEEIAEVARGYGAEVPFMRPKELAADDAAEWLAWRHAIESLTEEGEENIDIFLSVPPTSPLRAVEDLDACVRELKESDVDIVISVKFAERNPYFNMVRLDKMGYASLVITPEKTVSRRQAAPEVYDITTVAYAARPEFVLKSKSTFEGKVKTVLVPAERALDIDTELDFKIAECLLSQSRAVGD